MPGGFYHTRSYLPPLPKTAAADLQPEIERHTFGPQFPWRYLMYAVRIRDFSATKTREDYRMRVDLILLVEVKDRYGYPAVYQMTRALPIGRDEQWLHRSVTQLFKDFVLQELGKAHRFNGKLLASSKPS